LLGLERNDLGRGDRRGEVEARVSTTVGQRGASGLWPGEGLALVVGSQPHGVRERVCVL
jgi:hypothetical protein